MSDTLTSDTKHGERVRSDILATGLRLWAAGVEPTARRIASELDMTHANVLYHFKSSLRLRNAIAYKAVQDGNSRIIVQLIGLCHPAIAAMADDDRLSHMRAVR